MASFSFPLQFQRQNPAPLDVDIVFPNTAARIAYLSRSIRYPGQIVSDLQDGFTYKLNVAGTAWERIEFDSTAIAAASASWNQAYTNLISNSAAYLSGVDLSLVATTSASWNQAYTNLISNSAAYLSGVDLSLVATTSATWNQAYTNLISNSAAYLSGVDLSLVATTSATWNQAYTNLISNSAAYLSGVDLSLVATTSASWNQAYTNLISNSAAYLSGVDLSLVATTSASWNSVYSNVNANSGSYVTNSNADTKYLPLTGGIVSGNFTVYGNISATGTQTFANTVFNTTSALSVVHVGPGPGLWIGGNGSGDIASFYDIDQDIEVLHIGGHNSTYPNVGIKVSNPEKTLTVNGEISSNSFIWATKFYGDGSGLTGLGYLSASGGTLTGGLTGTQAVFDSISAIKLYGDGSNLIGVSTAGNYVSASGGTLTGGLTGTQAVFDSISAIKLYGDGSNLIGVSTAGNYVSASGGTLTGGLTGTQAVFDSISAIKVYGDGSNLTGLSYLSTGGGIMTGDIRFVESYGPALGQGRYDTSRGGLSGISLICSLDYDFNWQAGWLTALTQDRLTPMPLYIDSGAGTSVKIWNGGYIGSGGTGIELSHESITFPDSTIQTTAFSTANTLSSGGGTLTGHLFVDKYDTYSYVGESLPIQVLSQAAITAKGSVSAGDLFAIRNVTAESFIGDGSKLTGLGYLSASGGTLIGGLTGTEAVFSSVSAAAFYGDGSRLTGLVQDSIKSFTNSSSVSSGYDINLSVGVNATWIGAAWTTMQGEAGYALLSSQALYDNIEIGRDYVLYNGNKLPITHKVGSIFNVHTDNTYQNYFDGWVIRVAAQIIPVTPYFEGSTWGTGPVVTIVAGKVKSSVLIEAPAVSATVFYGDGSQLTGIGSGGTSGEYLSASGGTLTGGLTGTEAVFTSISAINFYGIAGGSAGISNQIRSVGNSTNVTCTSSTIDLNVGYELLYRGFPPDQLNSGTFLVSSQEIYDSITVGTSYVKYNGFNIPINYKGTTVEDYSSYGIGTGYIIGYTNNIFTIPILNVTEANTGVGYGPVIYIIPNFEEDFIVQSNTSIEAEAFHASTTITSPSASFVTLSAEFLYGDGSNLTGINGGGGSGDAIQTTSASVSCGIGEVVISAGGADTLQWIGNYQTTIVPADVWLRIVDHQSYFIYQGTTYYLRKQGSLENQFLNFQSLVGSNAPDEEGYMINLRGDLVGTFTATESIDSTNPATGGTYAYGLGYGPTISIVSPTPAPGKVTSNSIIIAPSLSATSVTALTATILSLSAAEYLGLPTTDVSSLSVGHVFDSNGMQLSATLSSIEIKPTAQRITNVSDEYYATYGSGDYPRITSSVKFNTYQYYSSNSWWTFEGNQGYLDRGYNNKRMISFNDEMLSANNVAPPNSDTITFSYNVYDILMYTQQPDLDNYTNKLDINVVPDANVPHWQQTSINSGKIVKSIAFIANWGSTTITPSLSVDGSPVTSIKWLGGNGQSSGDSNSYDVWTFTFIQDGINQWGGLPTYMALGSVARYY